MGEKGKKKRKSVRLKDAFIPLNLSLLFISPVFRVSPLPPVYWKPTGGATCWGDGSETIKYYALRVCARAFAEQNKQRHKRTGAGARTHIRLRLSSYISGLYHWNRELIKFPIKSRVGGGEPSECANFPYTPHSPTALLYFQNETDNSPLLVFILEILTRKKKQTNWKYNNFVVLAGRAGVLIIKRIIRVQGHFFFSLTRSSNLPGVFYMRITVRENRAFRQLNTDHGHLNVCILLI